MAGTAAAASAVFTVMRTSSEPARARACTWRVVAAMSAVSVLVIDCTTIGAPPPTRTAPMLTCTLARRCCIVMREAWSMCWGNSTVAVRERHVAKAAIIAPARNSLFGESPALNGRDAEGAIPPGNAQAHERQTDGAQHRGASGERCTALQISRDPPTEGERRRGA